MAAESNLGFRQNDCHAISFESGSLSSASQMIPFGTCFGFDTSTVAELMFPVNSSFTDSSTGVVQVHQASSSSTCSPLLDSSVSAGLKHDVGLAAEWSVEEQYKLEEGLAKYSDEPRILSYIKIAAMLPEKTVRDVALRCRWITRKRRKNEENNMGKRVNNIKDRNDGHSYGKHMETSSKMNWPLQQAEAEMFAAPPISGNYLDKRHASPLEGIGGPVRHLLEQNFEAFSHITANISSFKVQENIGLFGQTKNNIEAILDDLEEMPGIMSLMPPLPVCIDEDLVRCIFPNTIQSMMRGSQTGIRLKQGAQRLILDV